MCWARLVLDFLKGAVLYLHPMSETLCVDDIFAALPPACENSAFDRGGNDEAIILQKKIQKGIGLLEDLESKREETLSELGKEFDSEYSFSQYKCSFDDWWSDLLCLAVTETKALCLNGGQVSLERSDVEEWATTKAVAGLRSHITPRDRLTVFCVADAVKSFHEKFGTDIRSVAEKQVIFSALQCLGFNNRGIKKTPVGERASRIIQVGVAGGPWEKKDRLTLAHPIYWSTYSGESIWLNALGEGNSFISLLRIIESVSQGVGLHRVAMRVPAIFMKNINAKDFFHREHENPAPGIRSLKIFKNGKMLLNLAEGIGEKVRGELRRFLPLILAKESGLE